MYKLLFLIFISGCSTLFYFPDRYQYVKPENFNFKFQEVTFHPKDGTELIGWFFPAKTPKVLGTIVHFHGNAQNMSAHFIGMSWVIERGYNLFVFDYRGYGISDGKPTPDGVYLDSLAALDQGRKLWADNGKGQFVVYGQSLGGAVAMRALADYKDIAEVDLVVQDSTFMSYQDVGFHKLSRSLLFPFSPLAYLLLTDKYSTREIVRKIDRPTLVIVSKNDKVIDQKFGKELYKTLTTPQKWLWKVGGSHITTFHDPKGPTRDKLIELLKTLSSPDKITQGNL